MGEKFSSIPWYVMIFDIFSKFSFTLWTEPILISIIRILITLSRFVILHGTDTLAYTSSALSFMLENLGKPVIVTGLS